MPQERSAFADPDNDGWNNLTEFNNHTDPKGTHSDGRWSAGDKDDLRGDTSDLADSDGDGFPDSGAGGRRR